MGKKKRHAGEGSIYFDDKRQLYVARYTLGYDDDGRQIRKSISSKSSTVLIDKMKQFDRQNAALHKDAQRVTFDQWYYNWLYRIKRADLRPKSWQKYEGLYNNYVKEAPFADDKIRTIKMTDLKKWYNDLQTAGATTATVKYINGLVRSALADALQDRLILSNPTDKITFGHEIKSKEEPIKAWTQEEQRIFVDYLKKHPKTKSMHMLLLTLATGLRLGEAMALRWSDVDLVANNISISRAIVRTKQEDGSYEDIESTPKTQASIRTIDLPDKILPMLKQMPHEGQDGLIFTNRRGSYVYNKTPLRHLQALCDDLGINRITFHNLRHTYATRLFESGVSLKTVQALLGHAEIQTTQNIYVHVMQATKDKAVQAINKYF